MANIEDYIAWRGDLSFDVDPFNEVDNLILSELAYSDFGGIVSDSKKDEISIKDVANKFFELHTEEEIMDSIMNVKVAPLYLRPMAESERFSKIKLCGYVNEIDNETQVQFSVVTFLLPDKTYYVAYRGTDSSMIGWKEDFNMSYLYETPGQKRAVEYLNDNFKHCRKPLRVGGHSKGGNFAIFASAFCLESIQNRIINVYSNDGPGFREEVLNAPGYNAILPKIISIVPEQTLISVIQGNKLKHKYVKSNAMGIGQHDATTWQVLRNRFEIADRSEGSEIIDGALRDWLAGIPDEKRERFVDILFDAILMGGGDNTADEIAAGGLKNISEILKRIKELDPEDQKLFWSTFGRLNDSVGSKAYEHFIASAKQKFKNLKLPVFGDRGQSPVSL